MHRRIQYIVYPPNYTPGDGFVQARSWRQAKKLVRPGSVVHRHVHIHPAPRRQWINSFVDYVWEVDGTKGEQA